MKSESDNIVDVIIGTSTTFEGKLNSPGNIRIDGSISGELYSKGHVIVCESGYFKGLIKAPKITIAGKVEGNIYCSDILEIINKGKLYGDIEIKNISIENGAIFQGSSKMINSEIEG